MKKENFSLLTEEELKDKLNTLRKQYMQLELKRKSSVDKPHMFKSTRKDIARILTVLRKKELQKKG